MRTSILLAVVTLATLVGCSGGGATIDPGHDPYVPDGGDPVAPPGPDGSIPDGATPHDAAVPPDAAKDDRIDPIALGKSWTYDVTIIGVYPLCKAGSNTG